MTHTDANQLAKDLLNSEFDEINNNPLDYCKAMGWDEIGAPTRRAVKKAGIMSYNDNDLLKLTFIIVDLVMDNNKIQTMDITESNKVQNFLVNCVAEHINR